MNRVELIGHLGRDAEPLGKGYKFSVATSESYKDKDGQWQTATEWHNVKCFKELPFQLSKGEGVIVIGKIKTEKYQEKYYTSIFADTVEKLTPHQKRASEGGCDIGGYEPEPNDSQSDVPF